LRIQSGYTKFVLYIFLSGLFLFLIFLLIDYFVVSINIEISSIIFSWILCTLNVLVGTKYIVNSFDKGNNKFMISVFGGMVVRLFFVLGFIAIGLLIFDFEKTEFVISLFCFYFLFLIFELYYITNIKKKKILKISQRF